MTMQTAVSEVWELGAFLIKQTLGPRVRLPGDPVIGEGKPENQNHAMIFTRSEFHQIIDMNQEGYFEEALKMRNCLQEFAKREGPLPTTILGLREHIFTGSVSSLANCMALQEISFVTLGQRVLTRPLHIRLHYSHPDIFDKIFAMTRGGVSKASKVINLSEDIFAGYNNVLRGGSVGFKEYLQVGKCRDVGMNQIYKFEAKLSQGAAEQSLSRDVYRICHRLDFCRLLSFYDGGIGHYYSNVLIVLTVYVVVYLMTVLAVFELERLVTD
jgi:callose synthase